MKKTSQKHTTHKYENYAMDEEKQITHNWENMQ